MFRGDGFGVGVGPIFIDRLQCSGTETNILQCDSRIGLHSCTHDNDVSVQCIGKHILILNFKVITKKKAVSYLSTQM